MKKYLSILAVAAMAAYATSAFAQGTVVFANNTGVVQQWTSATDQTLIAVPKGQGFVQLAFAPANTAYAGYTAGNTTAQWLTANPGWALGPISAFNTPAAGKFNGGGQTLTGVAAGANADYVLFGWTGAAATYDAGLAGGAMTGVSSKFTTGTGGVGQPPTPAISLAGSFGGMTLTGGTPVVPEPSTFALAGLGAAALLIFRRRK